MSKTHRNWILAALALLAFALAGWWLTRDAPPQTQADAPARAERSEPGARPGSDDPRSLPPSQLAAVGGRVFDPKGQPLPEATVCASYASEEMRAWFGVEPICSRSGAEGRYHIDGLVPGRYLIAAHAEGFVSTFHLHGEFAGRPVTTLTLAPRADLGDIDIRMLGAAVAMEGRVEDLAGGVIADARVIGWPRQGRTRLGEAQAMTMSDDEGKFRIWVAPGETHLNATAEGYVRRGHTFTAPSTGTVLRLMPESVVEGVVLDEAGAPLAGVAVEVQADFELPTQRVVRSDEAGRFRIPGLMPGRVGLVARGPHSFGRLAAVALDFGATVQVEIRSVAATTLEARIVTDDDPARPCPAGWAELRDARQHNRINASSDAEGRLRFEGLLPGRYTVSPGCRGHFVDTPPPPITVVAGQDPAPQTWTVQAGTTLVGRIVDAQGEPATGYSARAIRRPKAGGPQQFVAEEADASGAFELHGLRAGEFELSASPGHRAPVGEAIEVTLPRPANAEPVELRLPAMGRVHGRVIDVDGRAVANVEVRVSGERISSGHALTDAEGNYALDELQTGPLVLTLNQDRAPLFAVGSTAEDARPAREQIRLASGDDLEVNFQIGSTQGWIRGRVLDSTGAPVPNAFVSAFSMGGGAAAKAMLRSRYAGWRLEPVLTDASGEFALEGLPDGLYALRAYDRQGADVVLESVELGSQVEIEMPLPASIAGRVVVEGGTPPAQFALSVTSQEAGIGFQSMFHAPDGRFEIDRLPPGTYTLELSSAEGDASVRELELAPGEKLDDIELKLAGKLRLTGRFVDDETGKAIEGLTVAVQRHGHLRMTTSGDDPKMTSDASGRWEVADAPPAGKAIMIYSFVAEVRDRYGHNQYPVEIPEGVTAHDLGDIRLTPSRVKSGQRPGEFGFQLRAPTSEDGAEDPEAWRVTALTPGGPAEKAGMKVGDAIIEVDGREVIGKSSWRFGPLSRVDPGEAVTFGTADGRSLRVVAVSPLQP